MNVQMIKFHGIGIHDMDNKWKTIANLIKKKKLVLRNLYINKIKN
jgi:hypothetical protein